MIVIAILLLLIVNISMTLLSAWSIYGAIRSIKRQHYFWAAIDIVLALFFIALWIGWWIR